MTVTGLENAPFENQLQGNKKVDATSEAITIDSEIDRIYTSSPDEAVKVLENGKVRYQFDRDMLPDVVVWNPWDAKSKSIADLAPDGAYHQFICVEAGSVTKWNLLEAGDSWEGGQRIKSF